MSRAIHTFSDEGKEADFRLQLVICLITLCSGFSVGWYPLYMWWIWQPCLHRTVCWGSIPLVCNLIHNDNLTKRNFCYYL